MRLPRRLHEINIAGNGKSASAIARILTEQYAFIFNDTRHCTDDAPATSQFFDAYPHSLDDGTFRRLLTPILSSAKSTNVLIRAGSVELFKVLIKKNPVESNLELALNELLALPKAGKTGGPDHRTALYSMLSTLPPSYSISFSIASSICPLVAKETHDGVISTLAATLPPHISFLLHTDKSVPADVTSLLAKEMNNSKPVVRRTFCMLVGNIFWALGDLTSEASLTFARTILPSFETSIKAVAANPLNASAGLLDGYIAMAVLLGPISRSGEFGTPISYLSSQPPLIFIGRFSYCGQCCNSIIDIRVYKTRIPILG